MPPPESNLKLSDKEKAIILKWIYQGAVWKNHWAFIPPEKIDASEVSKNQFLNEIDQYINDKLIEHKLSFESLADKETLIRRLSFDLTGLPPTIEQINQFIYWDFSYPKI